jgi:hypothetical protein
MKRNNLPSTSEARWTFHLVEEESGASISDAAELIVDLGFDPWALESLEITSESCASPFVITEFAVTGPRHLIEALHAAYDRQTHSTTPSPAGLRDSTQDLSNSTLLPM